MRARLARCRLASVFAISLSVSLAAVSADAQCTKDTECKGDRVCEAGACVSPNAASPALSSPAVDGGQPAPAAAPLDSGGGEPVVAPALPSPPVVVSPPPLAPSPTPSPAPAAVSSASGPVFADTVLALQLRLEGFYGFDVALGGGGVMVGVHAGATSWLTGSRWGLLYMGGAEVGALFAQGLTSVPASFSLELGAALSLDGDHREGTQISFAWAPRLLVNSSGGDAFSPFGIEVAARWGHFVVPVWLLRTTDQTTFLGLGVGYRFK